MTSFKAGIKTPGDRDFNFNALRFASREAAERYALDLAMRWTAVSDWQIFESDDEPNRDAAGIPLTPPTVGGLH